MNKASRVPTLLDFAAQHEKRVYTGLHGMEAYSKILNCILALHTQEYSCFLPILLVILPLEHQHVPPFSFVFTTD